MNAKITSGLDMPKTPTSTKKQDVKCHTIASLFKKQIDGEQYISCPACAQQVGLSAINKHLDETCLALQKTRSDGIGNSVSENNRQSTNATSFIAHSYNKSNSLESDVKIAEESAATQAKTLQVCCALSSDTHQKLTTCAGDHLAEESNVQNHKVRGKGSLARKLNRKRKHAESGQRTNQDEVIREPENKNKCNQPVLNVASPKCALSVVESVDDEFYFHAKPNIKKQLTFGGMLESKPFYEGASSSKVSCTAERSNCQQLAPKPVIKSTRSLSRNLTAAMSPVAVSTQQPNKNEHSVSYSNNHPYSPKNQLLSPDKSLKFSEEFRTVATSPPLTPTHSIKRMSKLKTENELIEDISSSVNKSSKKRSPLFRKIRAAQKKTRVKDDSLPRSPRYKSMENTTTSSSIKSPVSSPNKLSSIYLENSQIQGSRSKETDGMLSNAIVTSPNSSKALELPLPNSPCVTGFKEIRRPYYLENFLFILKTVLSHPVDSCLFNEYDKQIIDGFYQLPAESQKLYVRMFQRKQKWHQLSKIEYPDISDNIELIAQNLISEGLMLSETDLGSSELTTVLEIMKLPDLKNLCKALNVNCSATQKIRLIEQLLKQCRQQRTIFSMCGGASFAQVALKRAKSILGSCMKIATEPMRVFIRAMILFSLTNQSLLEDDKQNQQLLTLLFINMGKITFPPYTVVREAKIFRHRDDLVSYEIASQLEYDIIALTESGNWTDAHKLYLQSKLLHQEVQKDFELHDHLMNLPPFLKRFTAAASYIRSLSHGVEVLQRLRRYDDAVELLETLLDESVFHLDYHGRWMERLALNLEQHLKRPKDALTVLIKAFSDPYVTTSHRLSLHQRATRICNSARHTTLKHYLNEIPEIPLYEIPKVYIEGRQLPRGPVGGKSIFLAEGSQGNNEVDMCSVEEFAIKHFDKLGYNEGIHGESATFLTLYCLLFWDIIFMSGIPDVFRSPFQHIPLDMNCKMFYTSRKKDIDERLEWISESSTEILMNAVRDCWTMHLEEMSLVSWNLFRDVEHVQSLVKCFRPPVLSKICERYAKDYRHCRSGFPDLVVWNTTTSECRVIEVKGPNDRLSTKQILWLDYLLGISVNAEVCHVTVGKKLRKTKNKTASPKKPP